MFYVEIEKKFKERKQNLTKET